MMKRSLVLLLLSILLMYDTSSAELPKVFYADKFLKKAVIDSTTFNNILISPDTVFVPVTSKGDSFVKKTTTSSSSSSSSSLLDPILLNKDDLTKDHYENSQFIYLGQRTNIDDRHYVAVSYDNELKDVIKGNLRTFGEDLQDIDAALLSTARGMMIFHSNTKFCSSCGSTTITYKAGSARKCTNQDCKKSHYPRIEPASIMLIVSKDNQYALLGRKKEWIKGRYSTLAGFLEVGETIETCMIRETFEESNVDVDPDTVKIIATQPWVFPSSLMIGCYGVAKNDGLPSIKVDENEMEDVKWFHRSEVTAGLSSKGENGSLNFPGKSSLGRWIINSWINGEF